MSFLLFCPVFQVKWSGRNQLGAGLTIGEEVEQVNAYLSRAGVCTKYMSKASEYVHTLFYWANRSAFFIML